MGRVIVLFMGLGNGSSREMPVILVWCQAVKSRSDSRATEYKSQKTRLKALSVAFAGRSIGVGWYFSLEEAKRGELFLTLGQSG